MLDYITSHKSNWTSTHIFGLVGLVSHWSEWSSGQESFSWRLNTNLRYVKFFPLMISGISVKKKKILSKD